MTYYALKDVDWPWDDRDEGRAVVVCADTPKEAVKIATEYHIKEFPGAGGITWEVARLTPLGFSDVSWEDDDQPEYEPVTFYQDESEVAPVPADERVTITTDDAKTLIGVIEEFYVHNELSREETRAFLNLCSSGNFGRPVVTGRRPEQPGDERVVEALTDDAIRAYAKDRSIYLRESASVPDIRNGGWKHPYSLIITGDELRQMVAAIKAQEGGR